METTNLATIIKGVKITKTVSVKSDKDATTSKKVNLTISFDGVSLASIIAGAVKSDVIRWQGTARKKFDSIAEGANITIKYQAPPVEDQEAATVAFLAAMTPEKREEWILEKLTNR